MDEFEGHAHALRERKAPFLHCLLQTVAAQLQNTPADIYTRVCMCLSIRMRNMAVLSLQRSFEQS